MSNPDVALCAKAWSRNAVDEVGSLADVWPIDAEPEAEDMLGGVCKVAKLGVVRLEAASVVEIDTALNTSLGHMRFEIGSFRSTILSIKSRCF